MYFLLCKWRRFRCRAQRCWPKGPLRHGGVSWRLYLHRGCCLEVHWKTERLEKIVIYSSKGNDCCRTLSKIAFIYLFIYFYLFIICLFIYLFVFVYLFIICLFIYLFIYLSVFLVLFDCNVQDESLLFICSVLFVN